ncbi:hypothetical protein KDW_16380 [Dictyobacter vulcani]|uniref:Uncharacterized protein n=1 Tax=Dictyobacter vulcani TaxID=2607529 RepID=A0A5J4KQI6_9CHLR|nr:hypothetical protein [Dictyobacter vulcani]GER87476.1 hypothetical protein KDW_16380 [Dictyobacter vulcani]
MSFKGLFQSGQQKLLPVPVRLHEQQSNPETANQYFSDTWWSLCTAWLRYQRIQLQWDIERSIARRLHRRWGNS